MGVVKKERWGAPVGSHFWSKSEHRDPSKKTLNFRVSPKQPKSGIWVPSVPKPCPKESILEILLAPFRGPAPKVWIDAPLTRESIFEGFGLP